jgi:hypothetical protein
MVQFIEYKGINQTKVSRNSKSRIINEAKWDAKYDGEKAYIKMDINNDGIKKKYDLVLPNQNLRSFVSTLSSTLSTFKKSGAKSQPRFLKSRKSSYKKSSSRRGGYKLRKTKKRKSHRSV